MPVVSIAPAATPPAQLEPLELDRLAASVAPSPPSARRRRLAVSAPPPGTSYRVGLRRAGRQALVGLLLMIRNVAVSSAAALAAAFLASRGNAFSRVPAAQQSRRAFLAASLLTTHLLGSSFGLLTAASRLMSKRFVACQSRRPGLAFSLRRVLRFAAPHVALSTVAVVVMGFACAALPARVRVFKPEYFFQTLIGQCFSSACDANVRVVMNYETLEGRERQQLRRSTSPAPRSRPRSALARWARSFVHSLPLLASAMVAGLYIHVVNRTMFSGGRADRANYFIAGSLALKLALQELAKRLLVARGVTSLQHMCILVGVPTVLVDTQARVVMLGLQDATAMLTSTYAMAAVELAVRCAKLLWLRRAIARREKETARPTPVSVVALPLPRKDSKRAVSPTPTHKSPPSGGAAASRDDDARVAFATWRRQLVGLHTAETLADMYAEYIAIVCSAAVAIFWSASPHYSVGGGGASPGRRALPLTLGEQLVVELLVDYVASVIEIAGGVELDHARGFGAFLGSLFLMLTIVNMNMARRRVRRVTRM